MAKRKSSKGLFSTANIFRFLAAVLAIAAFCMMFGNQVKMETKTIIGNGSPEYSFSDTFFSDWGSPLGFIGYILILVGGLAACLLVLAKFSKTSKLVVNLLVVAILLAGTILVFLTAAPLKGGNITVFGVQVANAKFVLTAFPIIAGILGAVSTGCVLAGFLMDK